MAAAVAADLDLSAASPAVEVEVEEAGVAAVGGVVDVV